VGKCLRGDRTVGSRGWAHLRARARFILLAIAMFVSGTTTK